MERGNVEVLIQPAEPVTIGGAAIGTVLIAEPTLHFEANRKERRRRKKLRETLPNKKNARTAILTAA